MRRLVLLLIVLGLVVGALPLLWELAQQTTSNSTEVMYDGVYEPLPGVSMSHEPQLLFDPSLRDPDWFVLAVFPLFGAGITAAIGFILGTRGFALTRKI